MFLLRYSGLSLIVTASTNQSKKVDGNSNVPLPYGTTEHPSCQIGHLRYTQTLAILSRSQASVSHIMLCIQPP